MEMSNPFQKHYLLSNNIEIVLIVNDKCDFLVFMQHILIIKGIYRLKSYTFVCYMYKNT